MVHIVGFWVDLGAIYNFVGCVEGRINIEFLCIKTSFYGHTVLI